MGHEAEPVRWGLRDPQPQVSFAFRWQRSAEEMLQCMPRENPMASPVGHAYPADYIPAG
jgi:hypothetical protein